VFRPHRLAALLYDSRHTEADLAAHIAEVDARRRPGRPPCPRRGQSFNLAEESVTRGRSRDTSMIRKLKSGEYRLYSRKRDPKSGRRRNLGTFATREAAEAHERAVQFFKRRG
jgi:hypothetical protein